MAEQTGGEGEAKSEVVRDTEQTSTTQGATSTTAAAARQDIAVADKGYATFRPEYSETDQTSWAVIFENPNPSRWIAASVQVNVSFKDSSGRVLKTETDSIAAILPGQRAAVTSHGTTEVAGVAIMEIQARVQEWEETDETPGSFEAINVSTTEQQYGGTQTNATIKSTFTKDFSDVIANAIYRDGAGQIIGGSWTFLDFIPAGGEIGAEISGFSSVPGIASTEVIVVLTNLSLID